MVYYLEKDGHPFVTRRNNVLTTTTERGVPSPNSASRQKDASLSARGLDRSSGAIKENHPLASWEEYNDFADELHQQAYSYGPCEQVIYPIAETLHISTQTGIPTPVASGPSRVTSLNSAFFTDSHLSPAELHFSTINGPPVGHLGNEVSAEVSASQAAPQFECLPAPAPNQSFTQMPFPFPSGVCDTIGAVNLAHQCADSATQSLLSPPSVYPNCSSPDFHGCHDPVPSMNLSEPLRQSFKDQSSPPIQCRHCGVKFKGDYGKTNLARHMKTTCKHGAKASQFLCSMPGCGTVYRRQDALKKHQWKIHRLPSAQPTKRRPRMKSSPMDLTPELSQLSE